MWKSQEKVWGQVLVTLAHCPHRGNSFAIVHHHQYLWSCFYSPILSMNCCGCHWYHYYHCLQHYHSQTVQALKHPGIFVSECLGILKLVKRFFINQHGIGTKHQQSHFCFLRNVWVFSPQCMHCMGCYIRCVDKKYCKQLQKYLKIWGVRLDEGECNFFWK